MRLPRIYWAAGQAEQEQRWLPGLAPYLPLPIPVPLAVGRRRGLRLALVDHPMARGRGATQTNLPDLRQAAADLAQFITALHGISAVGGPLPGQHNSDRGVPLAERDKATRRAIASLDGLADKDAVTAAWDAALGAPEWDGPPVWVHGDLEAGNLLVEEGRLSAVIDFGCLGVGDSRLRPPAGLEPVHRGPAHAAFRAAVAVDEATWARGRG